MSDKPDIDAIKARLAELRRADQEYVSVIANRPAMEPEYNYHLRVARREVEAHAPADIAALLAEVERLQRERAEWRDRADALMTEQMTQMRDLTAEVERLRAAPAAPEGEVTEAMVLAGLEVFYAPVPQRERIATIYRAMRAARPAPTPEPSAQPSEELRLLRELRNAVEELGDTAQWRMRAEQRGYMVFCNAQDCADIADIQEELAALDAAEGGGR